MRIIRVNDDDSGSDHLLWVAAGTLAGLMVGVLVAEKMSGRKLSAEGLWRRTRGLAGLAAKRLVPLVGAAQAMRDAFAGEEEEDEDLAAEESEAVEPIVAEGVPDNAIDARVLEAFSNDPVLAERDVEIEETGEGRILLHGRVHTAREVAHAVTIARGVPGVSSVRQRLRVRDRR